METKLFTKQDLIDFIASEQFNRLLNIPITKHRAISQINNPRASDDDILLVVQFDENRVTGYLGILPDGIFDGSGYIKVGWLSCFWVDEDYKSRNVAANLFRRVIKAWDQKILITNIVPWLEPVYQRTGIFQPTQYKIGFRGYRRFNSAEILPPKSKVFKNFVLALRMSDFVLNSFFDIRFLFYRAFKNPDVKLEYLSHIDKASAEFINNHHKKNWNKRGKSELDWIINHPWIIEGNKRDHDGSRYYFSSVSKRFQYQMIKYSDHRGNVIGIMLLCIRNKNLTVPYLFSDSAHNEIISKSLINAMNYLKINMVTTFNEELANSLTTLKAPFLFKKKLKRPYLISRNLDHVVELNFQDGDGDCAFY